MWGRIAAVVFVVIFTGLPAADLIASRGKIYPGVKVGPLVIGGQTPEDARETLTKAFDEFRSTHATFLLGEIQTTLRLSTLTEFDLSKTIAEAQQIGRHGSIFEKIYSRVQARTTGIELDPHIIVNEETLSSLLEQSYQANHAPPQDARFVFTFIDGRAPAVAIEEGRAGTRIDLPDAVSMLKTRAVNLNHETITLNFAPHQPTITKDDLNSLLPEVRDLLSAQPVEIYTAETIWKIPNTTLATWIKPKLQDNQITLDYDHQAIVEWLDDLVPALELQPEDALFELDENQKKVVKFQIGKIGVKVPREENAALISEALKVNEKRIELKLVNIPPQITGAQGAKQYGISQLLGRGTTQFKGSPPNRVKNIVRGAEMLYGELIEPEEEFSLLDHLRPFTLENGYLSELVIKAAEGRTVPEIGGGLCQIGTTLFRTTLNAGLPITARRNHSYRVSYYEPPVGMDATIYDPAPDYKFKNNTGSWLLLTSSVDAKAMSITFELWGTDDGRKAQTTEPEVFNFRQPPSAKIIETTDLPPGVKKCTERAHIGSDAKFTYKVTYADGTVKEEEFKSRYRPWQEVCLLGVKPKKGEVIDTAPGEALPDTLPSADALGVVGDSNNQTQQ